jgi:hypothetical protein
MNYVELLPTFISTVKVAAVVYFSYHVNAETTERMEGEIKIV